jgi:hypothetical protein
MSFKMSAAGIAVGALAGLAAGLTFVAHAAVRH